MSDASPPRHARRPPLPYPLGWFAALFYAPAIRRINRAFDAGKGVVTLDRPVLSVGNLSVGGTGKTPMVMHVLRTLLDHRVRPCVAMRGYASVDGHSDEAEELSRAFRGVPIVVGANRAASLISFFGTRAGEDVECVVLDDGFQHRRLARQLDIVLVDATRDPFHDELLPAGWLREPVGSLRRAHAVVITHAESAPASEVSAIRQRIIELNPGVVVAVCRHAWHTLAVVEGGREREEPVSWLASKRVVAACAIGNPGPFLDAVRRAVQGDMASVILRDHDPFARSTVERLLRVLREQRAEAIVVTEKDWSKLGRWPTQTWPCPVVRAKLGLTFDEGEQKLTQRIVEAGECQPE